MKNNSEKSPPNIKEDIGKYLTQTKELFGDELNKLQNNWALR